MGARSKARRRALDVLFEADQRRVSPLEVLAARQKPVQRAALKPVREYAVTLVEGVHRHQERIDELISTYSQGWELGRMPVVDRQALRIGAYELLWCDDVPDAVAVDEAVALVAELSTDESPTFVNGLLGRLLQLKPTLLA